MEAKMRRNLEVTDEIRRALRLAHKTDSVGAYQALAYALRRAGFGWYVKEIDESASNSESEATDG